MLLGASTYDQRLHISVIVVFSEFVNYTQDTQAVGSPTVSSPSTPATKEEEKAVSFSEADFDELMVRIRHHVLVNRRRVCEYFQDFDPLRSGSITKSQFKRGLSDLGFSALGQHQLSPAQFLTLCIFYENPVMRDKVLWTRFMTDVESGAFKKERFYQSGN